MDIWNWVAVTVGLAVAIRELVPTCINRRQRDRKWWVGLFWGLMGLTGAASAGIAGVIAANDAEALMDRINKITANTVLDNEAQTRVGAALKIAARKSGTKPQLFVIADWSNGLSVSLYSDIALLAAGAGWMVETATLTQLRDGHDGIVIFVDAAAEEIAPRNDTDRKHQDWARERRKEIMVCATTLRDSLKAEGLDVSIQTKSHSGDSITLSIGPFERPVGRL